MILPGQFSFQVYLNILTVSRPGGRSYKEFGGTNPSNKSPSQQLNASVIFQFHVASDKK